jgi:hypothetical protein
MSHLFLSRNIEDWGRPSTHPRQGLDPPAYRRALADRTAFACIRDCSPTEIYLRF